MSWQICSPLYAFIVFTYKMRTNDAPTLPKSLSLDVVRTQAAYKELCFPRMKESYVTQIKQFEPNSQIPL